MLYSTENYSYYLRMTYNGVNHNVVYLKLI